MWRNKAIAPFIDRFSFLNSLFPDSQQLVWTVKEEKLLQSCCSQTVQSQSSTSLLCIKVQAEFQFISSFATVNEIDDEGGRAIGEALKANTAITDLNLGMTHRHKHKHTALPSFFLIVVHFLAQQIILKTRAEKLSEKR